VQFRAAHRAPARSPTLPSPPGSRGAAAGRGREGGGGGADRGHLGGGAGLPVCTPLSVLARRSITRRTARLSQGTGARGRGRGALRRARSQGGVRGDARQPPPARRWSPSGGGAVCGAALQLGRRATGGSRAGAFANRCSRSLSLSLSPSLSHTLTHSLWHAEWLPAGGRAADTRAGGAFLRLLRSARRGWLGARMERGDPPGACNEQ
jgi:hypothetical protein